MQVKLFVSRSGLNINQSRGDIVEVAEDEGERLVAAGFAERIDLEQSEKLEKPAKPKQGKS